MLFPYFVFSLTNNQEKFFLLEWGLKEIGLYPLNKSVRDYLIKKNQLHYGPYVVEKENWAGKLYIVFRKGRQKICELQNWFCAENKISKKHYITLTYGKKLVRKILSEYKVSARQRKYIRLIFNKENPLEVLAIDMQALGLPRIKSLFYQENGVNQQKK